MTSEFNYAVGRVSGSIMEVAFEGGTYLDGNVYTPDGIVAVYSQGRNGNYYAKASTYRFVWYGRAHVMTEDVARGKIGLAIVAGRFARRIVAEHPLILKARKA